MCNLVGDVLSYGLESVVYEAVHTVPGVIVPQGNTMRIHGVLFLALVM